MKSNKSKWKLVERISYIGVLCLLLYLGTILDLKSLLLVLLCYALVAVSSIAKLESENDIKPKKSNILYKGHYYYGVFYSGQSSIGRQMGILEMEGLDPDMPIFYTDALHEFEILPVVRKD